MIHPPFVRGVASTLDLFGYITVFDIDLRDDKVDQKALASDWEAIGQDMKVAIKKEKPLKLF